MDSVPTHIIRRQILELRGVSEADARRLQEEISELFREKILPLLDRYLSEHSPGDAIQRIERLELDIGTVFRGNLEKDFIEKVTRQLETYFQSGQSSGSKFKDGKEEVSAEKSHLEIFSFFVETGNLLWRVSLKDNDPIKESLDFLIRKQESTLRNMMYKWVRQPDALKRIVIQLGFPKWTELAATNLDYTAEELTFLLSRLLDSLKKITPWNDYPKHRLQEILGLKFLPWVFLSPHKMPNTVEFRNGFLIQLTTGQSVKYTDLAAELFRQLRKNKQEKINRKEEADIFLWKDKTPNGSLQANIFERVKRLLEVRAFTPEKENQWLEWLRKLNRQTAADEDLQAVMRLLEQEETAEPDKIEIDLRSDKRRDGITDELFINNAGLVILAPFLNRFFANLNLLDRRRFANVAAAHRAVGLLQFLVDGQEIPAEHQCGLNKILCGLDAETVLEFGKPITVEEAEACQTLLEAVVANAPILGEMSISGFRGSFLIRKGIVRAGTGAWRLNVERETFDVVLERFPWNWSIVKLPWMKWAVGVEWI